MRAGSTLSRRTIPLPILAAVCAVAVMATLLFFSGPILARWAETLLEYVETLGRYAPLAMIAGFVAVCLLSVPGAPLTLGCGFLFGVAEGTLVAAVGSTLGAMSAFLIARFGGRRYIRAKAAKKIRFRRLDRAARRHGFTIVLLTRISPLFPFNLLNYIYGLTSVHFRDYITATLIGVVPVSFLYVYVGSLMKTLAQVATGKVDPEGVQPWVVAAGLVLTVGAVVLLATVAKKRLAAALRAAERPGAGAKSAPAGTAAPGGEFDLFDGGGTGANGAAGRGTEKE